MANVIKALLKTLKGAPGAIKVGVWRTIRGHKVYLGANKIMGRNARVQRVPQQFNGVLGGGGRGISRQISGGVGEQVMGEILASLGQKPHRMTLGPQDKPGDLRTKSHYIEVKTGQFPSAASSASWKWRITLGGSLTRKKALAGEGGKKAQKAAKTPGGWRKYNSWKRKNAVAVKYQRAKEEGLKPLTYCLVLNNKTRTVDVWTIDGFHKELRYPSKKSRGSSITDKGGRYVASYTY